MSSGSDYLFAFRFNMICSKFASVNIATQFKLTLPLHYSSILSLIFLFFFNFQFSFFFCFRFSNMIYSKFLSKPVNFFAICSISIFHPHLISSSSFYPLLLPSSHLPSPSPLPGLKQTLILPRNCLHQWTLNSDCDYTVFLYFSLF